MCGSPVARSWSGRSAASTGSTISELARATAGARSRWDERTPIHVGSDKVHLKVKFSRFRTDGSLLGQFETIYIVTRQDGHWGIQGPVVFCVVTRGC
jgi:hypothetical protein